MPIIYASNNMDLILLFVIVVLVLEHPKSDGLVAAPVLRKPCRPGHPKACRPCHRLYQ